MEKPAQISPKKRVAEQAPEQINQAVQKCLLQLSHAGSTLYYACLFLTDQQKERLAPLLIFSWRVERILRFSKEPDVVKTQLNWWLDEIKNAFKAQGSHPIALALFENNKQINADNNPAIFHHHILSLKKYVTDCQLDDEQQFKLFCVNRRQGLINYAQKLLQVEPVTSSFLEGITELLTLLDLLDGFKLDAHHGLFYFPLKNLIKYQITTDQLIKNPLAAEDHNVNKFWTFYLNKIIKCHNQLWQSQQMRDNPLALAMILFASMRIKAWKIKLKHTTETVNLCYNQRPVLSPMQKLWLVWRIKSRWTNHKSQPRQLATGVH